MTLFGGDNTAVPLPLLQLSCPVALLRPSAFADAAARGIPASDRELPVKLGALVIVRLGGLVDGPIAAGGEWDPGAVMLGLL
jgi:hypothetical protein